MRSRWHVWCFVAILLLSTGISFVGYRYLLLANAYREANFEHLDQVYSAIDLVRQRPVPLQEDIRALITNVEIANEQSVWCIENLTSVDRFVFEALGAGPALELCNEATEVGNSALDLLNSLNDDSRPLMSGFVIFNQIMQSLETMRDQSLEFEPYVTDIEAYLRRFVRWGTGVFSLLLLFFSLLVARNLQHAQKEIETKSVTDTLTKLLNRRGLDMALDKRSGPITLMRIDLDRFKKVNDVLGHKAGDYVLRHVSSILRAACDPRDVIARVEGDEFVVLYAEKTDVNAAQALASCILRKILEPVMFEGKQCVFGASFGVAASDPYGLSHGELLNAADKALYAVKRSGRSDVAVYSDQMHAEAFRERALSDRVREALKAREIVPYFQTQHHADTGKMFGIEVLARWNHPHLGVLTPDRFFGVIQQMGLDADLDKAVFQQTVELVDQMAARGLDIPRVSFNVSAGRISDPNFIREVSSTIPENRNKFAFEILESISFENSNDVMNMTLDTLKELGFQIDVDDFGSEHASINSIMNIWPDVLKIDKNIVRPIVESEQALRMTVSIVDLAKALDMRVVAEGVDSIEKVQLLQSIGCHVLQGFFFSKPMSADDLEAFLIEANGARSIAC